MLVVAQQNNFQEEVLESSQIVLVDFYATWCGPCRMLMPILEELEGQNPNLKIVKVNVDEENELANTYEIRNLPTLLIFKNGNIVSRNVGSATKFEIEEWIRSAQ